MPKRRTLPPPPLVIRPILVRISANSPNRGKFLDLAHFLAKKRLLTDGGVKNLEKGFVGRNETCSLSTQDVRGWAQYLIANLWEADSSSWEGLSEQYFATYDKQKPRRPNHLQRLYLEWSPDYSWPGLLRAAREHPAIWDRLQVATDSLRDDHPQVEVLKIALASRNTLSAWDRTQKQESLPKPQLILLLGSLVHHDWLERLSRFEKVAVTIQDSQLAYLLICQLACSVTAAKRFPPCPNLEELARRRVSDARFHDVNFLCGHRAFIRTEKDLETLMASLHQDDPIRRVRFGPRPGVEWLSCFKQELESLIALRLARSSR